MADLLLELFSEEIPARMQADALEHLQAALGAKLKETGIATEAGQGFVTPRRLAVWIKNLPVEQAATETELKGPKVGAPEAALQGFLKKNGLTQADLTERDGVYFAIVKKEGRRTAEALKGIIQDILAAFPWPKSMRWGKDSGPDLNLSKEAQLGQERYGSPAPQWVRPLHSILCIFNGEVVLVNFAGITAGHITYGHRFLAPQKIMITNAADYEPSLEKAFVIASRDKRKAAILEQAQKAAQAANLHLKKDDGLLEEVTGLVEWPVMLIGSIDAKYMDLPKEVLVSEMRAHQKYFALEKADGALSDKFLITSNMVSTDGGKAIIAGNERVLRARLSDGRFFWDQDRKKTLDAWAEGLKSVTFHAKLGTIADKVERIKLLAVQLAAFVPGADKKLVERAALLCKADLTTGMVGEFPELQGVMGRYYASAETPAIADAIRDHYKPQGPADTVPNQPVSICVALADKLDTLVSMFAIGEKPTGSKDPFALRRAALGIIRIILENNIRVNLKTLFSAPLISIARHKAHEKLARQTEVSLHQTHQVGKYSTVNETACEDVSETAAAELASMFYEFFIDRLKVQLKDSGIRHDVINAVVADGDDDLVRIVEKAKTIQDFINSDDGANLLTGYKRAANILAIEEKKDKTTYHQEVGALKEPAELALREALDDVDRKISSFMENEKFIEAMKVMSGLRKPIDHFFDKIMVNCDDKELRINRLRLLSFIVDCIDGIAVFSKIEGETKEQKKAA